MPIDAEPVPTGRIVFDAFDNRVRFLRKDETTTRARFTSHFATCPHAERHRKPAAE